MKRFGRKALAIGRLRAEAGAFFFVTEVAALPYPAQCSWIFLPCMTCRTDLRLSPSMLYLRAAYADKAQMVLTPSGMVYIGAKDESGADHATLLYSFITPPI